MKIRRGFVANSSSASFVVLGYDLTDKLPSKDKRDEFFEKLESKIKPPLKMYYGDEEGFGEEQLVVGYDIAEFDGYEIESDYNSVGCMGVLIDLRNAVSKLVRPAPTMEARIWVGTRLT